MFATSDHEFRPLRALRGLALTGAVAFGCFAIAPAPAAAQGAGSDPARFATFTPSSDPIDHRIDYSIWDEALRNLVISMGPSLRETAGPPPQSFGTRRQYGHVSRYRLEGTRIMFSFLDADVIASFTEYRRDLEATADKVNIQSLSRDEQLAYWMNLHNVAMIEQIARNWPVRQPREIEIGGVPIDEARFLTVEGVALSPRDIRERIVYPNWSEPLVIYGFWRGDIGSPSIPREAYSAKNVDRVLEKTARDFVNSLRGTQRRGDTLQVSELYREAAPFYFPNFEADVRAHIDRFADAETLELLEKTDEIEASVTEYDIADLAGGVREPTYSNIQSPGGTQRSFRIPQSMARLLEQRQRKFERIEREGRTGRVYFTEIELPENAGGEPGAEDQGEEASP